MRWSMLSWEDLAPNISACMHPCVLCECDSQRCKLCVCSLCARVISENVTHPLVKEKRQTAALTSVPGHWGATLNQATERMCACFWSWDGLTGSGEKKYDYLSEADCRCRRGKTCQLSWRCFISPHQSVMQVELTRWPGKGLVQRRPLFLDDCIARYVFIYSTHA